MAVAALVMLTATLQADVAHDPGIRAALWRMMAETRYGFAHNEIATFIVRDERGRLSTVRWPPDDLPHGARWEGPLPRNVVAVAHTHPNWLPEPSRIDARTARDKRLAVYVVTRTKIVKTTGGRAETVIAGEWKP
jgi:hypothetical protein